MTTVRAFGHYFYLPLVFLGVVEWIGIAVTVLLASLLWQSSGAEEANPFIGSVSMVIAGILMLSMGSLGLYQIRLREGVSGILLRLLLSFLFAIAMVKFLFTLLPEVNIGTTTAVTVIPVAFVIIAVIHSGFFFLVDSGVIKRRILVVGAGERAATIESLRRRSDRRGFNIVGYLPAAGDIGDVLDKRLLIKDSRSLKELVDEEAIDEIVVAADDQRAGYPLQELLDCRLAGVRVTDIIGFFEREAGKIKLDLVRPGWLIFAEGQGMLWARALGKRLCDVTAGMLLLAVAWPVMMLSVMAILIESGGKGPIFYRQERVGQGGRIFWMIKFRSMRTDAEEDGNAQWATANDSRVTRVGALLRKTRVDELPQIINVLLGDMSFVGPRPERPAFVEELRKSIPYYDERHRVKPGITGWAQLRYPYGASQKDTVHKLEYDFYYLKNGGLILDLLIVFQTVEVILFGKGAR